MKESISLIEKLDGFIQRYHRNKALRGLLLSFATLTTGAVLLVGLEHVGRFGVAGRTVLFYTFLAAAVVVICTQVLWPTLQWLRLSRGLDHDEAAKIVGDHFPDVKDKLLNTLQLQQQVDNAQGADVTLLAASIDQRTASLRPLPFVQAVDVAPALRALRIALPVAVVVGGLFWARPTWVTEPANRIVQHRTEFVEPAPFEFRLLNNDLRVAAGDPFSVAVEIVGDELPGSVVVESSGGRFRMERGSNHVFRHTFPAVRSRSSFRFIANGWRSEEFVVVPFSMPSLAELRVQATPPPYTGLPVVDQRNQGDILVPEGTPIQWSIRVSDADKVRMRIGDKPVDVRAGAAGTFHANWTASNNALYWVTLLEQKPLATHCATASGSSRTASPRFASQRTWTARREKDVTSPALYKTITASADSTLCGLLWSGERGLQPTTRFTPMPNLPTESRARDEKICLFPMAAKRHSFIRGTWTA